MPWQLIYTSAPRLLTAGQTGFGTVARHRDIPPLVVSAVERASQFARLPGMDAARVVFSHRVVDAAGARYHVLSRVASAGADYTGRTNHLAHHLILTSAEAADLAGKGVSAGDVLVRFPWRSTWEDGARWLDGHETPDLAGLPQGPQEQLSVWMEAAGDRLHANHLVAGAGARSGCFLIAPAKLEMRRLFAESLRGVPEEGWHFTFTTEVDPGDSPGHFRWLGFSPESPVLNSIQPGRRLVLDLTRPASLPIAEALPEKRKIPAASPAAERRTEPPRVADPAGGAFVEPPVEPPPPLAAYLVGPMAAPQPPRTWRHRRSPSSNDHDDSHGWRTVGFIALGALAVVAMAMLTTGKWRTIGRKTEVAAPTPESTPVSPQPSSVPVQPAPAAAAPLVAAPKGPAVTAAPAESPGPPTAAAPKFNPWRAAHAEKLADLALPELRLEQTHMIVTRTGEERGPLNEVRNSLWLSPKDSSPVLRLDYAGHRAFWSAAPDSAAAPPVQWRILQDNREVLRILIGNPNQNEPLDATPISATQNEKGVIEGLFAEILQPFGGQALWLRPSAQVMAQLKDCEYAGPLFVPLRDLKADTSTLLAWVAKEQARIEAVAKSPVIGPGVPPGPPPPPPSFESEIDEKRSAPRSKQTNTLDNVPRPSSSVAGNMEQRQEQARAEAKRKLNKLAELRDSNLLKGRFGPGTCSFFAGPAGSSPADAVWIRDVAFAGP
jgi:hypothetical protein